MKDLAAAAQSFYASHSKGLQWAAGGALAFGLTSSYLAGRHRTGPRSLGSQMRKQTDKKNIYWASLLSGALTFGATALGFNSPGLRTKLFLGSSAYLLTATHLARGHHAGTSLVAAAATTAAGYGAISGSGVLINAGEKALKNFAAVNTRFGGFYDKAGQLATRIKKVHPLLTNMFNPEGLKIGAAIVAMPLAHKIVQALIVRHHRKRQYNAHSTKPGGRVANEAGTPVEHGREQMEMRPPRPHNATLNMRGSLHTHYQTGRA